MSTVAHSFFLTLSVTGLSREVKYSMFSTRSEAIALLVKVLSFCLLSNHSISTAMLTKILLLAVVVGCVSATSAPLTGNFCGSHGGHTYQMVVDGTKATINSCPTTYAYDATANLMSFPTFAKDCPQYGHTGLTFAAPNYNSQCYTLLVSSARYQLCHCGSSAPFPGHKLCGSESGGKAIEMDFFANNQMALMHANIDKSNSTSCGPFTYSYDSSNLALNMNPDGSNTCVANLFKDIKAKYVASEQVVDLRHDLTRHTELVNCMLPVPTGTYVNQGETVTVTFVSRYFAHIQVGTHTCSNVGFYYDHKNVKLRFAGQANGAYGYECVQSIMASNSISWIEMYYGEFLTVYSNKGRDSLYKGSSSSFVKKDPVMRQQK